MSRRAGAMPIGGTAVGIAAAARARLDYDGAGAAMKRVAMEKDELPIGPKLAWTPVARPQKRVIGGRYVLPEPVDPARHGEDLFELSRGSPAIWAYLGYGPFADLANFRAW